MKLNKKIAVPILSTAMGLSLIGGVGGAVAWYQYNSRVTASFVGSSVADSTILQIGKWNNNTNSIDWGRDVDFGIENKMVPVTFGELGEANSLQSQAYGYPEAGARNYDNGWTKVAANHGYVQYSIYLRAYGLVTNGSEASGKALAARDVYLSDVALKDITAGKDVSEALRVHLHVKDSSPNGRNFLISEKKVTNLPLFGPLDLDGVNGFDQNDDGYINENGRPANPANIIYGSNEKYQSTWGVLDSTDPTQFDANGIIQKRDANGYMPERVNPSELNEKCICVTPTEGVGYVEIVVTAWLEGWAELGTADIANGQSASIWNANKTGDGLVQVGMTFDTGRVRTSFN